MPADLFIMLNVSGNCKLILLSGSRGIICLDDKSIFLLPYKREDSNALFAFPVYIQKCVCRGAAGLLERNLFAAQHPNTSGGTCVA